MVTFTETLAGIELGSAGLAAFRQYLAEYTGSPAFTGLVSGIAEVTRLLDEVQYCVNIKGNRVRVTGYEGEAGGLLLCNESFASTSEREGSEIARQIIRALTEAGIRIVFVTHVYDLAGRYYAEHDPAALFLRAERRADGQRTFRVPPGEPLPTSYGEDLYRQVFGTADTEARA